MEVHPITNLKEFPAIQGLEPSCSDPTAGNIKWWKGIWFSGISLDSRCFLWFLAILFVILVYETGPLIAMGELALFIPAIRFVYWNVRRYSAIISLDAVIIAFSNGFFARFFMVTLCQTALTMMICIFLFIMTNLTSVQSNVGWMHFLIFLGSFFIICLPEEIMKYRLAMSIRCDHGYGTRHFSESKVVVIKTLSNALGYATMSSLLFVAIFMAGRIQWRWAVLKACGDDIHDFRYDIDCQNRCQQEYQCVGYQTYILSSPCVLYWNQGNTDCYAKPSFGHDFVKLFITSIECLIFYIPMHVLSAYRIGLCIARRNEALNGVTIKAFDIVSPSFFIRGFYYFALAECIVIHFVYPSPYVILAVMTLFSALCCGLMIRCIRRAERAMSSTYLDRVGCLKLFLGYGSTIRPPPSYDDDCNDNNDENNSSHAPTA